MVSSIEVMKELIKKRGVGLIGFLLFISPFIFWTPYYRTIDDELLSMLMNRWAISHERIDFLPWSHVFLARTLGLLKDLNQSVDWYALVIWGTHFIPVAILFFSMHFNIQSFLFFLLSSIVLLSPEFTYPTFTTASLWAGIAAVFLLLRQENSEKAKQFILLLVSILILFLSYVLRTSGGMLSAFLFLGFSLQIFLRNQKKQLGILFLVVFGGLWLLHRSNSKIINHDYPGFLKAMSSCTKIFDFKRGHDISEPILKKANWNREQLNLLLDGFLDFKEIHTQEACDALVRSIPRRDSEWGNLLLTWMELLKQRRVQLSLTIFLLGFVLFQPPNQGGLGGGIYFGFIISLISYCAIEMKVVDRVYMPFFNGLFFFWAIPGFSQLRVSAKRASTAAVAILLIFSFKAISNQQRNQARHQMEWEIADDLISRIPFGLNSLVFVWPDLLLKNRPIFSPPIEKLNQLNIVHAVHDMVNLPFHQKKMKEIGLNHFWTDLPSVETFWFAHPSRLWAVTEYLKKHQKSGLTVEQCWTRHGRYLFKLGSGEKLKCPS